MSRYVTVTAPMKCIVCGYSGYFACFFYRDIGRLDCLEYSIGDEVKWERFFSVRQGGRPPNGTAIVKGWAECPSCDSKFVPEVRIINDVVESIDLKSQQES